METLPEVECPRGPAAGPVPGPVPDRVPEGGSEGIRKGRLDGIRILKFGGSSLQGPDGIRRVAKLVGEAGDRCVPVVVVSAVGETTDELEALILAAATRSPDLQERREALEAMHRGLVLAVAQPGDQPALMSAVGEAFGRLDELLQGVGLLQEASARIRDQVLAVGEICSAAILAAALRGSGRPARAVDARELVVTDGRHGEGRVDRGVTDGRLRRALPGHEGIPVVTGFISATPEGITTTLGRGGSDLTATLLGAALGAEEVEIWTDVDGILTADPRLVPGARPLAELGYGELDELARFGAQVVHPPAVEAVRRAGIPLRIRSTLHPHRPGTRVVERPARREPHGTVRGVTAIRRPVLLRWEGLEPLGLNETAERLFRALGRSDVAPLLFTVDASAQSLSLAIPEALLATARAAVEREFRREHQWGFLTPPAVETDGSLLAVIGEGIQTTPGVAGRLFDALARAGVNVRAIAQGTSGRNVSCLVGRKDLDRALQAVHEAFLDLPPGAPSGMPAGGIRPVGVSPFRIAVVGTGQVGSVLLAQLRDHGLEALREEGVDPVVVAVARSRRWAVDPAGVAPGAWEEALTDGADGEDGLARAGRALQEAGGGVLVDCTASGSAGSVYLELLRSGSGVVSANKLPFAGAASMYGALLCASREGRGPLLFETTAGAALPWIQTVHRLRATGDAVLELEGAFSGTLTSVFEGMNRGVPFSRALSQAREAGLTEPDPRQDLGLSDVVRKLVILARTAGRPLEVDDVSVEPLLPPSLLTDPNPVAFLAALPQLDRDFRVRCGEAVASGKRLLPVARLDGSGQARVALEAVPAEGTLGRLRGTENALRIRTRRCDTHPLVIQGPGAGPAVTAAGLLSDLLEAARGLRDRW